MRKATGVLDEEMVYITTGLRAAWLSPFAKAANLNCGAICVNVECVSKPVTLHEMLPTGPHSLMLPAQGNTPKTGSTKSRFCLNTKACTILPIPRVVQRQILKRKNLDREFSVTK